MDIAVANRHFLGSLDRETIEAGYLPSSLDMILALTRGGPTSASKHLDGIRCQWTLAGLVKVVQVQILFLQPPELDTVLGHLGLDLVEELGPRVTHRGGTDEDGLLVGGQG